MINCVGEQFIDFQKTLLVVSTMLWVGTKFERKELTQTLLTLSGSWSVMFGF